MTLVRWHYHGWPLSWMEGLRSSVDAGGAGLNGLPLQGGTRNCLHAAPAASAEPRWIGGAHTRWAKLRQSTVT